MKRQGRPAARPAAFLDGGGEMGALMRAHDWSGSPLGAPAAWPDTLRSTAALCLDSAFPMAIYWGSELALLYNDAWRPILGGKHPHALGRPGREVWPEIWEAIDPVFAEVLRSGRGVFNGDSLLAMNRHGYVEECYFDYTFNPIRGGDGEVAGILNVVIETTYRVIAERRARLLRDFAARLGGAESIDGVIERAAGCVAANAIDIPFAVFYQPSADGRTASLTRSVGVAASARVDLADPAADPWGLARAVKAGTLQRLDLGERFGALPGGPWAEAPREAVVLPIATAVDAAPRVIMVAGASPRRALDAPYAAFYESLAGHMAAAMTSAEAFAAERRRAEALAEIDRAKTTFFSNVSHEFRTPLTLMLGPLDDVMANGLAPQTREQLEVVQRNGQRLLKLVNTLLDFARIEAGRTQASYEPTDLAALTADLASNFRSACERAGLALEVDCPALGENAWVDRELWEKIVLNLVSNAFKFTLRGGIRVSLRLEHDFVLEVRDTGAGISAAELPRMFERFHRVEGAQGRSHEGSGIGLALVQELVKLHGGAIRVQSELGRGSAFTVSIPIGSAHLPQSRIKAARGASTAMRADAYVDEALSWLPPPASAGAAPAQAGARAGPRVLLADDNADLREYARRLLAEHHDVEAVGDGEQALAAARARRPDLIVSDVMMPKLDGFGLIRELRADPSLQDVPVMLLSARAGEEARIEGLEKGADDYLTKPFSARELLVRAGALLQSQQARRQALAQVRDKLDEMETLLRALPVGVFIARDPACARIDMNPAAAAMLRMGEGENASKTGPAPEGLPFRVYQQGVEVAPHDLPMQMACRLGRPVIGEEIELRFADGVTKELYEHAVPLLDADGKTRGCVGVFVDISERKRGEKALRESEERFRALAAMSSDWYWEQDENFRYVHMSDEAGVRAGVRPTSHIGKTRWEMPHAGVSAEQWAAHRVLLERHQPFRGFEYQRINECGDKIWVSASGDPVFDAGGRFRGYRGTGSNIAKRKQAEEALREADRRKDEFIATLSHELRNPLAPLRNVLQLWRLSGDKEAPGAAIQDMMERQVNHLVRLVDDLLEMSRITRGTFELRRGRVDLAQVVRHAVESAQPDIEAAGHRLSVSLPREALPLEGDQVRLAQIIINLLNNASRYTPRGGRIAVEARREGGQAAVSVSDNGPGIAPEMLGRIFEMFSRGEGTAARAQGGLGIGLALSRRLAEMHGGTLEAASDGPGKGAAFTIRLPLSEAALSPPAEQPAAQTASAAPRRVMVVDDNRDAAESLAAVLKMLGSDVQVANDGLEALDAFERYKPAVVLLDIGMPGMDGYEVARRLRKRGNGERLCIVAVTGWGQEEDKKRAREAGFDHHLTKPPDIGALQALLAGMAA